MAAGQSRSGTSTSDLLARLKSAEASRAWKSFLKRYAPVIMHVVGQYEFDRERANDCFVYICEKLSDHQFRRLLSFSPEGPASFRGWFKVVLANLCIDWRRQLQGRSRPFQSIAELPQLEQQVFKLKFEQGLDFQSCLNALKTSFADLTEPKLAGAVERVSAVLTPNQYWLLSARQARTVSADDPEWALQAAQASDPSDDPETTAANRQERQLLNRALAGLRPEQRLLIKLRYQQDLSLKEVARLMRLGDPFRARRQIQAALEDLAQLLKTMM